MEKIISTIQFINNEDFIKWQREEKREVFQVQVMPMGAKGLVDNTNSIENSFDLSMNYIINVLHWIE